MTAKEKLHQLVEGADEKTVQEMLPLFEGTDLSTSYQYDEETLNILRERSEQYLSDKHNLYSVEESLELIRAHRKV